MRTIFLLFVMAQLAGCIVTRPDGGALIERLSTEPYYGNEFEPFLEEYTVGAPNPFGHDKRLYINNPKPYDINAFIACSSMFQEDPIVHVPAHSRRYIVVTGAQYRRTCFLSAYVAAPRVRS